ncbi:MAG: glycosyltransferase family 4 protein [Patescibacteria group bacterium]
MRILITTGIYEPDIGGPASYARTLAQAMEPEHQVTILAYSSVWRHERDRHQPFRVVRVWREWPKGIRHCFYFMRAFFLADKHDVILALNAASAGVPALWVARLRKKKLFVRIAGDHAWETAIQDGSTRLLINDFQKEPKKGWIGFLHRQQIKVCRAAEGVIVPSEYLAELVHQWGIPRTKIHVIYNGVHGALSMVPKEEVRKKIGISGNLIVSIGRLVPWKGFRMLVKIMPRLLEINQFFRLVIVGDGPDVPILKTMIRNLGLERKVILTGKKGGQDLADMLAAADMLVLNTGYEGFSHQVLEAMAAGIPVITTAVGGNVEVIRQGENGFLVRYNDEFNLIEAIRTLWQMPELRQEFIAQGQATARQFSIEAMVRKTIALLTSSHG